jgi:hypothetical protein
MSMLAEVVTLLTNILEMRVLNNTRNTDYPDILLWFFSYPPDKCQESALKYNTTAVFPVMSFTNHPTSQYWTVAATEINKKQLNYP